MCNIDYEHTQSTKAGAPGVDPGQLITESRLFPQRQTDVATGAPCCDRKVNADRVLFGGERRLKRSWYRGIEPTQGRGVRTTPASTRGHTWMGARTRTHELIGANRSYRRKRTMIRRRTASSSPREGWSAAGRIASRPRRRGARTWAPITLQSAVLLPAHFQRCELIPLFPRQLA